MWRIRHLRSFQEGTAGVGGVIYQGGEAVVEVELCIEDMERFKERGIMSAKIYDIPVKKITGEDASLAEFKGKVLLVVNVASEVRADAAVRGLEKLYEEHKGQGLVIAGFPANDSRARSRRTEAEIQSFCSLNYGSRFRCSAR